MGKDSEQPRVKQIIPVNDVWEKCVGEDGSLYFNKAIALALLEYKEFDGVCYLFKGDLECLVHLNDWQNPDNILFTHELPEGALKNAV